MSGTTTQGVDPIPATQARDSRAAPDTLLKRIFKNPRILVGGGILLAIVVACIGSTVWTLSPDDSLYYNRGNQGVSDSAPAGVFEYVRESQTKREERRRRRRPRAGSEDRPPRPDRDATRLITQPGFYADGVSSSVVEVQWQIDTPGVTQWTLERASLENFRLGPYETIATLDAGVASYEDTGLTPNTQYSYRLTPVGGTDLAAIMGTDKAGRSLLGRVLLGGTISLAVGSAAALISVVLGVGVGLLAGYAGGKVDSVLMRFVDVMYSLPYILLVILFQVGFRDPMKRLFTQLGWFEASPLQAANIVVLFLAIGLVSWLTMARVVRGQVLSLRDQPFIEAARAAGVPSYRIFFAHLLPNLVGPVIVYATLTVPQAILQESFLSFLGIGVGEPMPSWGTLAADGLDPALYLDPSRWWQLLFPCVMLAVTLLSLNFLGDGLRDVFDPRRETAKL